MDVVAGFDNDPTCEFAYTKNNHVHFHKRDIRDVAGEDINACYDEDVIRILVGCAPCQPFSAMRFKLGDQNVNDEKYNLLSEFGRVIQETMPTIVSMENVPQIRDTKVYADFISLLRRLDYFTNDNVVYCPDYGISQSRRRFVLLASRLGEIELIHPTHNRKNVMVKNYIKDLPPVAAGEVCPELIFLKKIYVEFKLLSLEAPGKIGLKNLDVNAIKRKVVKHTVRSMVVCVGIK